MSLLSVGNKKGSTRLHTRLHQHSAGYLCSRGAAHVACCCSPRRRGHGPLRRFASPFRSASSRPDRSGLFPDGGTWRVPSILRHRGCPTPTSRSSNSWQILTERRHRISSPCRCRCRCRREMIFFFFETTEEDGEVRPRLIPKIFPTVPVTSNFSTHALSIKCS